MLILNEDLFENIPDNIDTDKVYTELKKQLDAPNIDTEVVVSEGEIQPEAAQTPENLDIVNELSILIRDEWQAIEGYNRVIKKFMETENQQYIDALTEIENDEMSHVGVLQEIMRYFSENVSKIAEGELEGQQSIEGE